MKINREVVTTVFDSEGNVINIGDRCVFNIKEGKCLTGVFKGFSKHNALIFEGVIKEAPVTFNVMPNSIALIKRDFLSFTVETPAN
jgi:hypothetical protein